MRLLLFCLLISCLFFSCQKNELNYIPDVISPPENIKLNQGFVEQRMNLEGIFSDQDGEPLQISALSNAIEVVATRIEGKELIISEKGNGTTKITLRATDNMGDYTETKFGVEVKPPYLRFAVISDPHFMDPSLLGQVGTALINEKNKNPLMFEQSHVIVPQTIEMIASNFHPKVLIINGDLTKDGSLASHQAMVGILDKAQKLDMQVYVVPGCRDINNYNASRYSGSNKVSVPNITQEKYKTLYHNFGYNDDKITFSQDLSSLSYACEPQKGVYMIMIDSNSFEGNNASNPYNEKSRIKPETLKWIESIVSQAKDERKTVITFMHGALAESFTGEATHFTNNLIDDADNIANTLANLGIKVIFTGHNHIQDISEHTSPEGNRITQISTGALLAYPNPFRIITLKTDQNLSIKTHNFSDFYQGSQGALFLERAKDDFKKHYSVYINNILSKNYGVTGSLLTIGTNAATEVGVMHAYGDEKKSELDENSQIGIIMLQDGKGKIHDAGVMLNNMANDLFPRSDVEYSVPKLGVW
ncbi:metallophosphoesterase [Halosquirtibacter xylanolyticus]|uniref:metallophosphoesterase family protein n=1 Tax=Halosquirtibacter xylanolyticus TaxID=3374599 RepID=UPI003748F41E|nr:metallophosphoesterase [Prolixibacteraceae bacterium]